MLRLTNGDLILPNNPQYPLATPLSLFVYNCDILLDRLSAGILVRLGGPDVEEKHEVNEWAERLHVLA